MNTETCEHGKEHGYCGPCNEKWWSANRLTLLAGMGENRDAVYRFLRKKISWQQKGQSATATQQTGLQQTNSP